MHYQYNNKELNPQLGLNWYDYGARFYDPAIARWMSVDPLAEKYLSYTPYNYTLDNPVNLIDPDGRDVINTGNRTIYTGGDAQNAFRRLIYSSERRRPQTSYEEPSSVIAKGGPLEGKNLNDYFGYKSNGFVYFESSSGKFIKHEDIRNLVQDEIDHLGDISSFLTELTVGSWVFSGITSNTSLSGSIKTKGINIPITVILSMLVTSEKLSLNNDQKKLFNALLDYYQSDNQNGLYEIRTHTGNTINIFSEYNSYNLYYSDGNHLITTSRNALPGVTYILNLFE
ncbi:MAG: RHS repeat-associated core domain-containing protein [Chitinophagales bacterium]|nr:hypothetical protein [Bacteroidota bacterium]MCB9044425.1 hypothetical protein [Chitinophagales bacterium]